MSFSNEIKTILKIDGKDWEKSIKSISEAEKSYFKESTENIDKLINSKEELAKTEAEHRKKIITLNREIKESEKQLAKDISSNNTEKIKQTKELIDSKKKDLDISIKSIDQKRAEVKNTQITIEQINRYKKLLDETKNSLQQLHGQESKRQSTQEKDIANMKEQYKTTYELTSAQVKYNEAKKRLDGMLTSGAISQEQYNKGLATEGKLLKENKGSYETATNAVVRHLRQIETLIVSYYMLKGAWDATIGVGINVNRTIESNTQGIAALITANTRMTTSTGQAVTNQQKFAMSQTIAAETMKKIKTAAIDTAGTFEDLIMIFQQATGQTLSMGDSMGGSIKEIIDNTIQLSKRMANIAGAIGMPLDRVREEIRSLLSGNASTDSLISTMLFGSPSQANQAMEKAKASGKDGVKKLLDEMLAPFDVLEGLMTYDIQFNRMKDAYQSLAATVSKPIFDEFTESFASVANYLTPKKVEDITEAFKTFGNVVGTVAPIVFELGAAFVAVKVAMTGKEVILGLASTYNDLARASKASGEGLLSTALGFDKVKNAAKAAGYMALIIGAYELYNSVVSDTLDKEKKIHDASNLKLEDIKKLTVAQTQASLIAIKQKEEMQKEELRAAIKNKRFRKTMFGDYAIRNLEGDELVQNNALIDTLRKDLAATKEQEALLTDQLTVKNNIVSVVKQAGELSTKFISLGADPLIEKYTKETSKLGILTKDLEEISKRQKQLDADMGIAKKEVKGGKINAIESAAFSKRQKEINEAKAKIKAEIAEINKKESTKASSILNTEEKKEYNIELQRLEEDSARARLNEIAKVYDGTIKYDEKYITEYEKYQLQKFSIQEKELNKAKEKALQITELGTREFEISKAQEGLYSNKIKLFEYILGLSEKQNDATQKGIDLEEKRKADINSLIGKYTIKKPEDELGLKERLDINEVIYKDSIAKLSSITEQEKKELDEVFAKSQDKFKNENLIKQYKEDMTIDIKLNGFDDVSNSISSLTNGFVDMNNSLVEYNSIMYDVSKSDKERAKAQQKYSVDTVGAYGNMAGALGSFYKEGSTQAKNFQKVQQAMYIAQMAMQMSALMTQTATSTASIALMGAETTVAGTLAVAKQAGAGDPYTAFARVAAMAALLASFGIIVGGIISGKDKQSTVISYDALSAMADNKGTGTVLGDIEAGSDSIKNSLEILSDLARPEYNLTSQMAKSLESIDNKISGVTTMLLRNAGYALGEGFSGYNYSSSTGQNVSLGSASGTVGMLGIGAGASVYTGAAFQYALANGMATSGIGAAGGAGAMSALPWVAGAMIADKLLLDGAITNMVGGVVNSVLGGVFGGGTSTSSSRDLADAGLIFGKQLVTKAITDFTGSAYQTIKDTVIVSTDGGWFGSDSTSVYISYSTQLQKMDEEIRNQFELIMNGMYNSVLNTAEMLDGSREDLISRLADFEVNLGKISLKGLSGEDMQEKLSNVFGKTMDEIVTEAYAVQDFMYADFDKTIGDFQDKTFRIGSIFSKRKVYQTVTAAQQLAEAEATYNTAKSDAHTAWLSTTKTTLDGFQKVGETISETLMRVSTGMQEAEYYIKRLGYQYDETDYKDIINQQGDAGAEALRQSLLKYEEEFYNNATGIDEIVNILSGTAEEVYNSFVELDKLRNQLSMIGQDVNGITLSMISGAGGIEALSGGMSSYFDNFLTEQEKSKFLTESMSREFEKLNIAMPSSNDEFKALIQGLDLSTDSGQDLFGRLILLSDGFKEVEDAQNGVLDSIKSLTDGFTSMTDSIQETIDKLLGIESGNSQEQMIRDFWTRKDEVDKLLSKGGDLTETELSTLSNLINQINSLSTNIQSSQVGDVSGITANLVSELLGIKSDVALNQGLVNSIYTSNGGTLSATGGQGLLTQFLSSLPSYDTGTPYLPSDMVIQAHQREMIIDPQSSDVLRKYGIKVNMPTTPANNLTTNENKGIIEAINKQTEEVKKLNARMEKIELLNKDTRDNTERMAIGA